MEQNRSPLQITKLICSISLTVGGCDTLHSLSSRWVVLLISPVNLHNPLCVPCNIGVSSLSVCFQNPLFLMKRNVSDVVFMLWWVNWTYVLNVFAVLLLISERCLTGKLKVKVSPQLYLCLFYFRPSMNVAKSIVMECKSAELLELAPLAIVVFLWMWNNSNFRLSQGENR